MLNIHWTKPLVVTSGSSVPLSADNDNTSFYRMTLIVLPFPDFSAIVTNDERHSLPALAVSSAAQICQKT